MSKIAELEKDIVKMINFKHGTKFKLADLMEWSTAPVKPAPNEVLYEAGGYYCAFRIKS